DGASRNLAHGSETCVASTAKKVNQKRFDEIVRMVCEKNGFAFSPSRSFSEEFIAGFPSCGFNRCLPFHSEATDVRRLKFEFCAVSQCDFFYKAGVGER